MDDEQQRLRRRRWSGLGLLLAAVGLAWAFRDVAILVALTLVLVAALAPVARWLEGRGLSRHWSSALCVGGVLVLLIGGAAALAPLIAKQAGELGGDLPALSSRLGELQARWAAWSQDLPFLPPVEEAQKWAAKQGEGLARQAAGAPAAVLAGLVGVLAASFLSFYFLLDRARLREQALSLVPPGSRATARSVGAEVFEQVGRYVLGRLVIMAVVGVLTGIGLALAGVPYAAVLGLVAGLLDVIPFIGPWIAAVPGVLVGATEGPDTALWAAVVYAVVQAAENYVLSPLIFGRAVGVHPVWIFLALMIGQQALGVVGLILAVPGVVVVHVLIERVYHPYLAARAGGGDPEEGSRFRLTWYRPAGERVKEEWP